MDNQRNNSKLRDAVDVAVIPYRSNQKRDVEGLLRVDRKFRAYGPEDQKKEYHKRPHVEAVYSFLKTQYSLTVNKVRVSQRSFICAPQHSMPGSEPRGSRKHWKI